MDNNRQGTILLTLLDFSKAFDIINHSLLLAKLRADGVSNGGFNMVGDLWPQCVWVGIVLSTWVAVACGVPQGLILLPLLFSLYVNDVHKEIKICKFHIRTREG